ncbi:MAG: hypothetical protein QOE55_7588 [Acidobacteriaceae bacterium]|nr:hypothetical protein [Acidobacteriaceae bacterium]
MRAIAIAFSSESASADVITVSLSMTSTIHVSLQDVYAANDKVGGVVVTHRGLFGEGARCGRPRKPPEQVDSVDQHGGLILAPYPTSRMAAGHNWWATPYRGP